MNFYLPFTRTINLFPFLDAIKSYELWIYLAWQEITLRYRRSIIGPFWITIGMIIFISTIGFIFSQLFNREIKEYIPHLAISYVVWWFIASSLNDATVTYIKSAQYLKEIKINPLVFVFQSITKNIFIFFHNFIIIFLIYFLFGINPGVNFFAGIFTLAILFLNIFFISSIVSLVCSRYRDFGPIIQSVVQVLFFTTPITWMPESLGVNSKILLLNPFTHLLNITRMPFLGNPIDTLSFIISLITLLILFLFFIYLYSRKINRLVFWV